MKKNKNVSVCMRVHEIGDCLPRTMEWLIEHFEEINVVDSGQSTDNTTAILNSYKNQINLYTRPFDNFQNQTNFILEKNTKPWFLAIDGDEIIYSQWTMDQIAQLLEKQDKTLAIFDRINFQKDIYHKQPVRSDYQYRLFKSSKRATGQMHDLYDISVERCMFIPKVLMLHWGHIRSRDRLIEKTQIYKKFINIDSADGAMIKEHDDWFAQRNVEWDANAIKLVDSKLIEYVEKWDAIK